MGIVQYIGVSAQEFTIFADYRRCWWI